MALKDWLYRCAECGGDTVSGEGESARCPECGTTYARVAGTGRIEVTTPEGGEELVEPEALEDRVRRGLEADLPERYAATAIASWIEEETPLRSGGEVYGFFERRGPGREVNLTLEGDEVTLDTGAEEAESFPLARVAAVQTSSTSLQLAFRGGAVVHLSFPDDSPKRWEDLLHRRLQRLYRAEGRGEILEFQPRIVAAGEPRVRE